MTFTLAAADSLWLALVSPNKTENPAVTRCLEFHLFSSLSPESLLGIHLLSVSAIRFAPFLAGPLAMARFGTINA